MITYPFISFAFIINATKCEYRRECQRPRRFYGLMSSLLNTGIAFSNLTERMDFVLSFCFVFYASDSLASDFHAKNHTTFHSSVDL